MRDRTAEEPSDDDLTPQERRLVDCAARGETWWPEKADDEKPDMDPANVATWNADRTIRAEVIRCLVIGDIWPGMDGPWPVSAKGILMAGARVKGEFDLQGTIIERTVWLVRCTFDAIVNLIDAETKSLSFHGSHLSQGLVAVRANIKGNLHLCDVFSVRNKVDLGGARITGQLACNGGSFENSNGPAFNGEAMIVGADVFLDNCFSAKGEVNLMRAKIEGLLNCTGSTFENTNGDALNGNGMTVGGSVFLRDGFSASGLVDLVNAKIGGQLACRNGHFENAGGPALNADSIAVGTDVFLSDGFSAKGMVNFYRAEIHGNLRCDNATFANPAGNAIDLTLANIGAGLFLRGLGPYESGERRLQGRLILEQAECRTYCDDSESWPEAGKLVLDGFVYERFHGCDTGWKCRREWLLRQINDHLDTAFHPQPWTQAIKVLREMGHDSDAKELAVCREIARAKSKSTKLHIKIWHYLLRLFVGNGYKPERALYWSAGFVLLGWLVFATAGSLGYMAPRDGNVRVSREWNEKMVLPHTYPPFNGLVYALDAYLPVIEFGQDEAWEPSAEKTIPTIHAAPDRLLMFLGLRLPRWLMLPDCFFTAGFHRVLYWIEEIAGWVLVSLFIAGMSGLMKKE